VAMIAASTRETITSMSVKPELPFIVHTRIDTRSYFV